MSLLYLGALLVSMGCMALVDHRWELFAFGRPRAAGLAVAAGFVFFVVWDLVAIALGMYVKGDSPAMSGLEIAPHFPVEELVFITFLCYLAGVFQGLFRHLLEARVAR